MHRPISYNGDHQAFTPSCYIEGNTFIWLTVQFLHDTILSLFSGTLGDIFKKSQISFLAVLVCILNSPVREHSIHSICYLHPGKPVYVIKPEHDPQLTLINPLYVLLRPNRQFQKFPLHPGQLSIVPLKKATVPIILWYRIASYFNTAYCSIFSGPFHGI